MQSVVVLFDRVAGKFDTPVFVDNLGVYRRMLADFLNSPQNQVSIYHQHSADFDVYILSEYDNFSGTFIPRERPEFLFRLIELLPQRGGAVGGNIPQKTQSDQPANSTGDSENSLIPACDPVE